MNSLLLLIPVSLALLGVAIAAFAWAVRHGQFDDLEGPALDILVEAPGEARRAAASGACGPRPQEEPDAG